MFFISLNNVDNKNGRLALFNFNDWTEALPVDVYQTHVVNGSDPKPFEAFVKEGSTHIWDFKNSQVNIVNQVTGNNENNLTVSMTDYFVCDPKQWLYSTKLYTVNEEPTSTTTKLAWYKKVECITAIAIVIVLFIAFVCFIGFCQNQEPKTSRCVSFFKVL